MNKLCISLVSLILLTSCGSISNFNTENTCTNIKECALINDNGLFHLKELPFNTTPNEDEIITQERLLKIFGKPDKIIKNPYQEIWHYEKLAWKGDFVYILLLPIPLMHPFGKITVDIDFRNGIFESYYENNMASQEAFCSILPNMDPHGGGGWCSNDSSIKQFHSDNR